MTNTTKKNTSNKIWAIWHTGPEGSPLAFFSSEQAAIDSLGGKEFGQQWDDLNTVNDTEWDQVGGYQVIEHTLLDTPIYPRLDVFMFEDGTVHDIHYQVDLKANTREYGYVMMTTEHVITDDQIIEQPAVWCSWELHDEQAAIRLTNDIRLRLIEQGTWDTEQRT